VDWDEEKLWRTYAMLTDLEGVFRSLKSELGLRPVYHHKEGRSDAHLFITVLAYQAVQVIRRQLQAKGKHARWTSLRETLSVQRQVTASFTRKDGRTPCLYAVPPVRRRPCSRSTRHWGSIRCREAPCDPSLERWMARL